MLTGCKEDEISDIGSEGVNPPDNELLVKLTAADYNSENTYYILNDNEPSDVYFNNSQRSFYVNQPLQLTLDDNHYFQLRFYSPRKLSNVTIWAKIDGYEEAFKFMELEEIRPFQQLRTVCHQRLDGLYSEWKKDSNYGESVSDRGKLYFRGGK